MNGGLLSQRSFGPHLDGFLGPERAAKFLTAAVTSEYEVGTTSGQVTPLDASPFLVSPSRGPASVLSHRFEKESEQRRQIIYEVR